MKALTFFDASNDDIADIYHMINDTKRFVSATLYKDIITWRSLLANAYNDREPRHSVVLKGEQAERFLTVTRTCFEETTSREYKKLSKVILTATGRF